jgi:hypothetical protein
MDDPDKPRGFDHKMVLNQPDLICAERWSDLAKYEWEINPAYRDFLISENAGLRR